MAGDNPIGLVLRVLVGGAVISGGLLFAAQALHRPEAGKEVKVEKIGPTMTNLPAKAPATPTVQAIEVPTLPPVQSVAPAPKPPAVSVIASPAAPALIPQGAAPQNVAPAVRAPSPVPAPQAVALDSPAIAAEGDSVAKPARPRSGAAGCTSYKTYNAQTQTYRGFDGKTYDCR